MSESEALQVNKLEQLEFNIRTAISDISSGKTTPQRSRIGMLFTKLQMFDTYLYNTLVAEYKPISRAYYEANPIVKNKKKVDPDREYRLAIANLDFRYDDFDEHGELKDSAVDRAVKETLSKVDRKPIKVKIKAEVSTEPKVRDRQTYIFDGAEYGKGPLVRAILTKHSIGRSLVEMKQAFPDSLLRSYGIFKTVDEAKEISKVRKRYFLNEDQLIILSDCSIAVCNQFTSDNIAPFLKKASDLGYKIEM